MCRTDHLWRDLGKDEQCERYRYGAQAERELTFAEQTLRDDRCKGRGGGGHEGVSEQDHAKQLVGLSEQRKRQARSGHSARRSMLEAISIDRHHRGLRDREKTRRQQQGNQREQQRS